MKMSYAPLFLAVILAGCMICSNGSKLNDLFLDNLNIVSTCQDQDLCDRYLALVESLPCEWQMPYKFCLKNSPKGVGSCGPNSELFTNAAARKRMNQCYVKKTTDPDGYDWSTQPALLKFQCALNDLAKECKGSKKASDSTTSAPTTSAPTTTTGQLIGLVPLTGKLVDRPISGLVPLTGKLVDRPISGLSQSSLVPLTGKLVDRPLFNDPQSSLRTSTGQLIDRPQSILVPLTGKVVDRPISGFDPISSPLSTLTFGSNDRQSGISGSNGLLSPLTSGFNDRQSGISGSNGLLSLNDRQSGASGSNNGGLIGASGSSGLLSPLTFGSNDRQSGLSSGPGLTLEEIARQTDSQLLG